MSIDLDPGPSVLRRFALKRDTIIPSDPMVEEWVERFHPDAHMVVRLFFVQERFRQMGEACPGLILFMAALRDIGIPLTGDAEFRIAAEISDGRPLAGIIDRAVERWLWLCRSGFVPLDPAMRAATGWLDGLPPPERTIRLKRWRLLVRRAVSQVKPSILLRPPPIDFAPEEIPTEPNLNDKWFQAMASHDAIINPSSTLGPQLARRFCRTLSRAPSLRQQPRSVIRYLQEHPRFEPAGFSRRKIYTLVQIDVYTRIRMKERLPEPPLRSRKGPLGRIWPLNSVSLLRQETQTMHHCASSYTDAVKEGTSYLYGAQFGDERLTVEVQPDGDGDWHVTQVKGVFNGLASKSALKWLRRWCRFSPGWKSPTVAFPQMPF